MLELSSPKTANALVQICTKCHMDKLADAFNRDKTKADGLQFRCGATPSARALSFLASNTTWTSRTVAGHSNQSLLWTHTSNFST